MYLVVATGIVVLHDIVGFVWLSLPALPVTILASTIGILLAFRNNSGYDRWWEARTLWGGIVNHSRTFARRVLTMLPPGEPEDGVVPHVPSLAAAVATDGAVRDRHGRAGTAYDPPTTDVATGAPNAASTGPVAGGVTATSAPPHPVFTTAVAAATRIERCDFDTVTPEARELVYAQIALATAIRCHLRQQDPLPEIAPFLHPAVLEALRNQQNVPAALLVWMARRIRLLLGGRGPADVYRLVALDETLTELTNLLGGCERIKNTPIPRQYDWLPRIVVRAYLLFLPLAAVEPLGLVTPLVTAVIAFLFLSLDLIGHNVEAPFENDIHDTPMTALTRTIEINLRQMLGETELPPPVQPVDGFLY
jgi:putative membrane protein